MNEPTYKVTTTPSRHNRKLWEVMLLRWTGSGWETVEGYIGEYRWRFEWEKHAIARDKMRRLPVAGTTDNEQVD